MPSPLVFLSLLAGLTTLALTGFALRNRDEPGAPSFAVFTFGAAVWSLSYAGALVTFDPAARELFEISNEIGQALVAPAWLMFALGYTGRSEVVTRKFVAALAVVPVVTTLLVATNDAHHLMWANYRVEPAFGAATVLYDPGPWFYLHAAYGYLLIGTGVALIGEMLLSQGAFYREQALAMLVGSLVPTVAHVKRTFLVGPFPQINFTPVALAVTGLAFGYALFRFELFGLTPTTRRLGRRAAIDDVGVGVVIVNPGGRIVEVNRKAQEVLERSTEELLERSLSDFVPGFGLEADGGTPETVLTVGDDRRTYELTTSAITDQHDRLVGHTVTLNDITEREQRRQRLEVLNRVLRHNLRNDMTVVLGYAQTLEESLPEAEARMAATIERKAQALVDMGEKARKLEQLIESPGEPTRVDVASLLRAVCDELGDAFPAATVTADLPDELVVETVPDVLDAVVENLVENAIEHNDADAPQVWVSAAVDGGGLVVTVADDGPGIPDHELDTIDAGTETPLQHGSGIGLWLVHWGVRSLGGGLSFETGTATDDNDDSRGTTATVRLPVR